MDMEQQKDFSESLRLCDKLLKETEENEERIKECLNGELLKAYLYANDMAEQEIKKIHRSLQTILR